MGKNTRSAAAIRYDESVSVPFVLASGRGDLAERLLTVARRFGVPVEHAPELAERLVYLDPGEVIPEELFVPVAQVLAFVLDLEEKRIANRRI